MKYFALLTKLGENLLAQATALGTKLELTHMAVGDGGGSLPTPDTNQTKLIKEQRRAAINTLFIDEKNPNQIIAEQIIPESEGGWWIREIGLFDKAGNLVAIANCPETYKPQLAEGSGRTQSIRMVLIVSHTESVTLKIDPSVVLATREYVNTEITILDKKIDALSTQTKLDLNKKFDKANISSQKGNDNDKVPSLNLFSGEIGKLQPKGDYALVGYSYSKVESDNKYQPKGNYASAGNYATSEALKSGLDGKFDKTGGSLTGYLAAQKEVSSNFNGSLLSLITSDESRGPHIAVRRGTNGTITRHNMPTVGGALMQVGDYGWGGIGDITTLNEEGIASYFKASSNVSRVFRNDADSTLYHYKYSTIAYFKSGDTYSVFSADYSGKGVVAIGGNNKNFYVYNLLHDRNTTTDRNGNLKASGAADHLSDCRVGCPLPWPQTTPPTGYLICNGQSFNKTTFPLLALAYPSGVLPDLRGEFIRGLSAGRDVDAGRSVLSAQGDAIRNITGEIKAIDLESSGVFSPRVLDSTYSTPHGGGKDTFKSTFDASRVVPTAVENRPRNIAFLYIVRAA
ncbi:MAG: phage tail protein [Providencia heimbachae]|nr:phage tail protein [Providencia heimbachae]